MISVSKSLSVEVNYSADNLTIHSHLSVKPKEKLGTMDSKCVSLFEAYKPLANLSTVKLFGCRAGKRLLFTQANVGSNCF